MSQIQINKVADHTGAISELRPLDSEDMKFWRSSKIPEKNEKKGVCSWIWNLKFVDFTYEHLDLMSGEKSEQKQNLQPRKKKKIQTQGDLAIDRYRTKRSD